MCICKSSDCLSAGYPAVDKWEVVGRFAVDYLFNELSFVIFPIFLYLSIYIYTPLDYVFGLFSCWIHVLRVFSFVSLAESAIPIS